jgi:hypothetical protein
MRNRIAVEQKWHQQSEEAKHQAEKLPHGREREALTKRARQLETASRINQWLSSGRWRGSSRRAGRVSP